MEWLLEGDPWVRYRTRVDLLGEAAADDDRQAMVAHPAVQGLLAELVAWPGPALQRHNDAKLLMHKLVFLADIGLRAGDPGLDGVIERILEHQAPEGPFEVMVNIPKRFGGKGEDEWTWILCDSPLIAYALLRFGLADVVRLDAMADLVRANGWPCAASPGLGKFRGPGRKDDPCPIATLYMLRALSAAPPGYEEAARVGAAGLLQLWERRQETKPYLFGMGTKFKRLKAPLIWYDILHVVDVLTRFAWLRDDPRLGEMLDIVRAKADEDGRFKAESVWMAWKTWEFGQKREPSRWVTFLARRALHHTAQG